MGAFALVFLTCLILSPSTHAADHGCTTGTGTGITYWYVDTAAANAACTSGGQYCIGHGTGPSRYYSCGGAGSNVFYSPATVTCTYPEVLDEITGTCIPDPTAGNPIAYCNDPDRQLDLSNVVGVPVSPQAFTTIAALSVSDLLNGSIDLTNTTETYCHQFTNYNDSSGEELLECELTISTSYTLNDDFNVVGTQTISNIAETEISTNANCGITSSNTSSFDLSQYGIHDEQNVYDQNGNPISINTSTCYTTRNYSSTTGNTEICEICVISENGFPPTQSVTESCTSAAGDQTFAQDGDGGTGTLGTSGEYVQGSVGSGSTTGTAGTAPGTGTTQTQTTGNEDLIQAIAGLQAAIEAEEAATCDDPNGCEDFAEIIEDYDGVGDIDSITSAWDAITAAFTDQETDLTNVANNTGSLTSGVSSGDIGTIDSLFPTGNGCTPFVIDLGEFGSGTIGCDKLNQIKTILTVFLWLYVLLHLRNVIFRPAAVN